MSWKDLFTITIKKYVLYDSVEQLLTNSKAPLTVCPKTETDSKAMVTSTSTQLSEEKNADLERRKKNAAYALNLCMVSISQIVDYEDLTILEQEYDGILNNLNLQNMPKDEALLKILKQTLDTITFFRIQEVEKKMLEKKYQHQLKNAIWNAIPSLNVFVAGSPATIALSLATTVGTGYMTYRRAKNQINIDHEEARWKLQRSAIEQFNALRRELFDTSWRLADEYGFEDRLRLTEKQIAQFNEILMDPNPLKRYERLYNIKDKFDAYPPFWYYIGHAANEVFYNEQLYEFHDLAIKHFEKFKECNDLNLLRKDPIRSSCNLEYVDLLTVTQESCKKNKDLIISLTEDAYEHSGEDLDVFQICAINYLKIGCHERAIPILRNLVVEGFNTKANAIILSKLYLVTSLNVNKFNENEKAYKSVKKIVRDNYLLPWPSKYELLDDNNKKEQDDFIKNWKTELVEIVSRISNNILDNKIIEWNKFMYCHNLWDYTDSFYQKHSKWRYNYLYNISLNEPNQWERFIGELRTKNMVLAYENTINSLVNLHYSLFRQVYGDSTESFSEITSEVTYKLKWKAECYKNAKTIIKKETVSFSKFHNTFCSCYDLSQIFDIKHFTELIKKEIDKYQKIEELIKFENCLYNFCVENGIEYPEIIKPETSIEVYMAEPKINLMQAWGESITYKIAEILKHDPNSLYFSPDCEKFVFPEDENFKPEDDYKYHNDYKNIVTKAGQVAAYIFLNNDWHLLFGEDKLIVRGKNKFWLNTSIAVDYINITCDKSHLYQKIDGEEKKLFEYNDGKVNIMEVCNRISQIAEILENE